MDKKGIIKTAKLYNKSTGNKIFAGVSWLFVLLGLGIGSTSITYNALAPSLPDLEQGRQFMIENDYNLEYQSRSEFIDDTRLNPPIINQAIKFNVCMDDVSEQEKEAMKEVIDEFNDIFKVINPQYKFVIDFSPSLTDIITPTNIVVKTAEKKSRRSGVWYQILPILNKNGLSSAFSKIELARPFITTESLKCIFTHEIMHHLGVGDAYKLEERQYVPTIMDGCDYLTKNDIALLVSKYADLSTPEKQDFFKNYIETYEQNQPWYNEIKNRVKSELQKLIDAISRQYNINADESTLILPDNLYAIPQNAQYEVKSYAIISIEKDVYSSSTLILQDMFKPNMSALTSTTIMPIIDIGGMKVSPVNEGYIIFFTIDDKLYYATKSFNYETWLFTSAGKMSSKEQYLQIMNIIKKSKVDKGKELHEWLCSSYIKQVDKLAKTNNLPKFDKVMMKDKIFYGSDYRLGLDTENNILNYYYGETKFMISQCLITDYGIITQNNTFYTFNKDGNLCEYKVGTVDDKLLFEKTDNIYKNKDMDIQLYR